MDTTSRTFEDTWALADPIKGWLTEDQARLLWDAAVDVPANGSVLEIGSHQGRSTVVLASAVAARGGKVLAVDPFVDGRLFGGKATRTLFEENVARSGHRDRVELIAEYSTRLRPRWDAPIDMLYIDGKHDYWTVADDLQWAVHLPEGAGVLIHDCFSSVGVTLGILAKVLPRQELVYVRRAGSLALFRVGTPTRQDRLRILAEMPWWTRNVGIKVLLRARLDGVARRLGHDSPYDPY